MASNHLEGKVALVTGAGGGIGGAIAARLGRDGCAIVVSDVDLQSAAVRADALAKERIAAIAVQTDVSHPASVDKTFKEVERRYGRLHILVNCAAIMETVNGKRPRVMETPVDLWQKVIATNLTGPFLVSKAAFPLLKRDGWGRIVNIASRGARMLAGPGAYSASKAGLLGLSRVLAAEFGEYGITVNCVSPSRVLTAMTASAHGPDEVAAKIAETPLRRIATPEDMAAAVSFLASDDAAFVTGAILDVTGGSYMP